MNDQAAISLRYRELGFFDLHDSASSLLADAAQFLNKHRASPKRLETERGARGWHATLELEWSEFTQIFDGMNADEVTVVATEDGAKWLNARIELRSATVLSKTPWASGARVQEGTVLLNPPAPPAPTSSPRTNVVMRPR
jgi:hypothetical protein